MVARYGVLGIRNWGPEGRKALSGVLGKGVLGKQIQTAKLTVRKDVFLERGLERTKDGPQGALPYSGQKGRVPRKGIGTNGPVSRVIFMVVLSERTCSSKGDWNFCFGSRSTTGSTWGQKGRVPRKGIGTRMSRNVGADPVVMVRKDVFLERGLEPRALLPMFRNWSSRVRKDVFLERGLEHDLTNLCWQLGEDVRKDVFLERGLEPVLRHREQVPEGLSERTCSSKGDWNGPTRAPLCPVTGRVRKDVFLERGLEQEHSFHVAGSAQDSQKGRVPRKGIGTPLRVSLSVDYTVTRQKGRVPRKGIGTTAPKSVHQSTCLVRKDVFLERGLELTVMRMSFMAYPPRQKGRVPRKGIGTVSHVNHVACVAHCQKGRVPRKGIGTPLHSPPS